MKFDIVLLETNFTVEYDFTITAHSFSGSGPSFNSPGEPPEPAEFDLEVLALYKEGNKEELEMAPWFRELILDYLYNSDAVYAAVHDAEYDSQQDYCE